MYKNILAALDLESNSNVPLITGLRLAAEYGAALRVISVIRPSLFRTKGFFSAEVVEKSEIVQEAKAALQARLQADNAEHVKAEVMVGDPGETIAGVAQHREADLVIIGARSRYLSETVLGTTATTVLRETESADVYACHRTDPEASVDRMLLAIDGSTTTPHVLNNTHELIESSLTRQQPEIRIACVVNDLQRDEAVLMKAQTQVSASRLSAVPVEGMQGEVVQCLGKIISEYDADLMIIGSGKNFGVTWQIGSTTNDLLHESRCDVLVIRSA